MQDVADQSAAPTTIGADLCAVFISLELSRSTWLATSLSPGRGEKMSKHSVSAGDIAALLARFSELGRKACARTGKSFPIVVIQEAGLDGFWIHRVLLYIVGRQTEPFSSLSVAALGQGDVALGCGRTRRAEHLRVFRRLSLLSQLTGFLGCGDLRRAPLLPSQQTIGETEW
jgi:hypothetical protein